MFALRLVCVIAIASTASASVYGSELAKMSSLKFASQQFLGKRAESQLLAFKGDVTTIDLCMGAKKCKTETIGKYKILTEDKTVEEQMIDAVLCFIASLCIGAAVAYYYKSNKEWPIEIDPKALTVADDGTQQWSSEPFDCSQDWSIFCCSCCCMPVRWADTMSMVGILPFWHAFALLAILDAFDVSLGQYLWPITIFVLVRHRQQFRQLMQLPGTGLQDVMLMLCCSPCAVAQEARHVEAAARYGHPAVMAQRPLKDGASKAAGAEEVDEDNTVAQEDPVAQDETV